MGKFLKLEFYSLFQFERPEYVLTIEWLFYFPLSFLMDVPKYLRQDSGQLQIH